MLIRKNIRLYRSELWLFIMFMSFVVIVMDIVLVIVMSSYCGM